jgi:hypothetical protein
LEASAAVVDDSPEAVARLRVVLGRDGKVAGKLVVLPPLIPSDGFGRTRFLGLMVMCWKRLSLVLMHFKYVYVYVEQSGFK